MLTKVYTSLWIATSSVALAMFLTGTMTVFALVVFGFIAFGLVFMGMMGVLPATVVHAHTHAPVKETPTRDPAKGLRSRLRGYKETLATETLAVRKPKFP
jgi:hypothetical protein